MGATRRLWALFRRPDRDIAAELQSHLDLRAEANCAAGLASDAAQRAAERRLGNSLLLRERIRDVDTFRWLADLARDCGFALRGLRRSPGFAAVAIVTLALGIGANTAIFSVVEAVVLRPLPFPQPQRLVALLEVSPRSSPMGLSFPDYLDWRADSHSFTDIAAIRGSDMALTHLGAPAMVVGQRVSASYFSVLGVHPALGRAFLPAEDRAGTPDVVVLSDSFWRQRLGADPHWLGRTLDLDGHPRTIVGIMPPGPLGAGMGADDIGFLTPLGPFAAQDARLRNRASRGLLVVGRLRPGVTLAQARADLGAVARHLAQRYPAQDAGIGAAVQNYLDAFVDSTRPALLALLAAVGLVLLIACANVANLLLARAAAGRKADAIRSALGASRARLLRAHLAESLCLGLIGSGLGLLLATWCLRAAPALLPASLPRARQVSPALSLDPHVLAFALLLALATTLLCGVAPAFLAGGANLASSLQPGGRAAFAGGHRLRGVLAASEMALALLLLLGAGLLLRSMIRLQAVPSGINPDGVLTFIIGLPDNAYPRAAQQLEFFRQAAQRLARVPGVTAVGGAFPIPFASIFPEPFHVLGAPLPPRGQVPSAEVATVRGDYFQALGIHLLQGRFFTPADTAASAPVAIVDATFLQRYPRARRISLNGVDRVIVGVVAHVRGDGLAAAPQVETYVPQTQDALIPGALYFVLRTPLRDPLRLAAAAAAQIQSLDPDQPITDVQTMRQRLDATLAPRRLALALMAAFALLALLLAAIGIYAVLSYAVAQRTHEIGIRMALGAARARVLAMVLGHGLRLALAGAAAGLAAALILGRCASSFLYGVTWADPLTLLAVPALLLAIAALACYLPARRATRVAPAIALRGE